MMVCSLDHMRMFRHFSAFFRAFEEAEQLIMSLANLNVWRFVFLLSFI